MQANRFDDLLRALPEVSSRRGMLRCLTLLTLTAVGLPGALGAKKKGKRGKNKKLKKNEFGCVNVGGKCRGKDANCCSGICEGKKPKKGKKDKSRCVGHDVGTCQPGQDSCVDVGGNTGCMTSSGAFGGCYRTTGKATYCAAGHTHCHFPCQKDADCRVICGAGAACIVCPNCEEGGGSGTSCVGIEACNISG